MQSITSFALYGFPESHAASFALLAYASAYLKCHYLAAFTAALLNNQPMGFYQPFTIIKDAQRHGLEVKPVDITCSEWLCTLEEMGDAGMGREGRRGWGDRGTRGHGDEGDGETQSRILVSTSLRVPVSPRLPSPLPRVPPSPRLPVSRIPHLPVLRLALRLGLKYVKGLRAEAGQAIVCERLKAPFAGIDDLSNRVPELRKDELRKLAAVGALNFIQSEQSLKSHVSSLKQCKR